MMVDAHQDDRWAGLGVKPKTILSTIFASVVQYGIGYKYMPGHVPQGLFITELHGLKGFLDNAVGFFY